MRERQPPPDRGAVLIAAVILVLVLGVLSLTFSSTLGAHIFGVHYGWESAQAYYAAESGLELGLKELIAGSDVDGDGTAGSISNDANAANDPAIGGGRVYVTYSASKLAARGRCNEATRVLEVTIGN